MYNFISRYTGDRTAIVITGFVYAVLIMMVLYASIYPQAELKYTAL